MKGLKNVWITIIVVVVIMLFGNVVAASSPDVELSLSTASLKTCPCQTNVVVAKLINNENLHVSAEVKSHSSWVMVAPDVVELEGMSLENIYIYITPSCEAEPGVREVEIEIYGKDESGDSFEIKKTLSVDVLPCHVLKATTEVMRVEGCYGDVVTVPVVLKNEGMENEDVAVEVKNGYANEDKLTLAPSEEREVIVGILIKEGVDVATITFNSMNSYAKAEVQLEVYGKDCYSQQLEVVEVPKMVCANREAEIKLRVTNTGSKQDVFQVVADGEVEPSNFLLKPAESKEVVWRITETTPGNVEKIVKVISKAGITSKEIELEVKDCEGIALVVLPKEREICADETADFLVVVKNLGVKEEEVKLTSSAGELDVNEMEVKSGETKTVTLRVDGEELEVGDNEVKVVAENSRVDEASVKLSVKSMEECYGFETELVDVENSTVWVEKGGAKMLKVLVRNTGLKGQNYTIYAKLPSWVDATPSALELKAGEESYIYLHVAPPYNITDSVYPIQVSITNNKGMKKDVVIYLVVGNVSNELVQLITGMAAKPALPAEKEKEKKKVSKPVATGLKRVVIALVAAVAIVGIAFGLPELKNRFAKRKKKASKGKSKKKKEEVKEKKEEKKEKSVDKDIEEVRKILESI